jgi:hypothetical protein
MSNFIAPKTWTLENGVDAGRLDRILPSLEFGVARSQLFQLGLDFG